MTTAANSTTTRRLRISVFGAVQGVGFRPFVCRLARELGLSGWVLNGAAGLRLEVEGGSEELRAFEGRLRSECPRSSVVAGFESSWIDPVGETGFEIRRSEDDTERSAWLLPDLGTCPDCLAEMSDPSGRRRGYAFTNCTQCGPRYSVVTAIPYDRPNTTMAAFDMCPDCAREYGDPEDRRFHAQPIACPACGPRVWLEEGGERTGEAAEAEALEGAARLIEKGRIVALKGIGGFQLLADARSASAVERLRKRKRREEKPFALMFPSIDAVRRACAVSGAEEEWLGSPAAPIVLLRKLRPADAGEPVAEAVAPGNPRLGAMLPYSPLHRLLMERLGFPVVATSGNLSEEPIAIDNDEARARLGSIADAFLMHDRPIARHADDSIVRLSRGERSILRRARGFAPLPVPAARELRPVLALGAHLKSTVSIGWERRIVTSQHLGDLSTAASWEAFQAAATDLRALYGFRPEIAACDLHPDYLSTQYAESLDLPVRRVQHHHAHIAACMAERDAAPPVLGVAWDGLGLGPDGTVWGGEFLRVDERGYQRLAHLRTFPLSGGEAAVREPRRSALGLLSEAGLDAGRLEPLFGGLWASVRRLAGSESAQRNSSMGRLFDAVACLAGLGSVNSFEGQAAMALENALGDRRTEEAYPLPLEGADTLVADWGPLLAAVLDDADRGEGADLISARFHNALARLIVEAALALAVPRVVLSGGVFQNAYLVEAACGALEREGFSVYTHQRLPCNDGGVSAGQAFLAGSGWSLHGS